MTSKERKEVRFQHRKEKRLQRKLELARDYGVFDKVFTFEHLYTSYKKCCLGVNWKASTQKYKANALLNVNRTLNLLLTDKYKSNGFFEFDIMERGKTRHIKSVHISERVVQRCLCDYCLVPFFSASFIHDNGACMKGKGIHFAINRFACQLQRFWRKHGKNGYILFFDFSKYFDNISHSLLKDIINGSVLDAKLKKLINQFIDDFGEVGLGLGSQVSQISALLYPNKIDHYIKEVLHIKHYGRYMDDGYLIHENKQYLKYCLAELQKKCADLKIKLNPKKTQIVKLGHILNFLKIRFFLTENGKIIKKVNRKSITRMRHKLKAFKRLYIDNKLTTDNIKTSYVSWCGYLKHINSYNTKTNTDNFLNRLFTKINI